MPRSRKQAKAVATGLQKVDAVALVAAPTLQDYLGAVSEYVLESPGLGASPSKTAQIALGAALGRVLRTELMAALPRIKPHAGELSVAGALRVARADVSESHHLDGLRLAVEIKPVNRAVGRALWNRFGDIRAFAVNIHLKFPFAVVGGVLAVPEWEWAKLTKKMLKEAEAALAEAATADEATGEVPAADEGGTDDGDDDAQESSAAVDGDDDLADEPPLDTAAAAAAAAAVATVGVGGLFKKPTLGLLARLVRRLIRTRRRETEADAAHLLEAVAVIVYDPDTAALHPALPPAGSGLRWEEFVARLADAYELRFE